MANESDKMTNSTVYHWVSNLNPDNLTKAACFDLDWTLVRPNSSKFPKTYDDSVIMSGRINILNKYIEFGYTIIIFTNQKITKKENLQFKLDRINDILNKFGEDKIYPIVYMSIADDKYRKPNIGMWEEFRKYYKKITTAFYCGDAAGRSSDFSDSDLKFAENIGVKFYTPEELF